MSCRGGSLGFSRDNLRDVERAVLDLMARESALGHVYNIGTTEEITIASLADEIMRMNESRIEKRFYLLRAGLRPSLRGHDALHAQHGPHPPGDRIQAGYDTGSNPQRDHRREASPVGMALLTMLSDTTPALLVGDETPALRPDHLTYCRAHASVGRLGCLPNGFPMRGRSPRA